MEREAEIGATVDRAERRRCRSPSSSDVLRAVLGVDPGRDPFHMWLIAGTAVILVRRSSWRRRASKSPLCLLVLALAPAVTVVGYETLGHRRVAAALERL